MVYDDMGTSWSHFNVITEMQCRIATLSATAVYIYWYIGYNDRGNEGTFIHVWPHLNTTGNYTYWRQGEPNDQGQSEDCVEIASLYPYRWNDIDCNRQKSIFHLREVTVFGLTPRHQICLTRNELKFVRNYRLDDYQHLHIYCFAVNCSYLQYIPRNMHTVLLCFVLLWLCNRS